MINVILKKINWMIIFLISFILYFFYSQSLKYNQESEIKNLKNRIEFLHTNLSEKDSIIVDTQTKYEKIQSFVRDMFSSNYYNIRLTGYHPVKGQTDSTPDVTADGTKIDINKAGEYKYVALSRDLLSVFNRRNGANIKFGDYVMIKGTDKHDGIYQVRDTMNKRHTTWADILLTPGDQSFYYKNVLMYKINDFEYVPLLEEIYGDFLM